MAEHFHLEVILPEDRSQSGILVLKKNGVPVITFEALGRGSQGAGDTQLQVNGNTPTGEYEVSELVDTSNWPQGSFGPHGALRLDPVSGNAVAAEEIIGRHGLLIHGGDLGGAAYWRGADELRATHGCIRLRNHDMQTLIETLLEAEWGDRQCVDLRIKVTVTDHSH